MRVGQETGTDGPHALGTRFECEVTSLWSQVIRQDGTGPALANNEFVTFGSPGKTPERSSEVFSETT